MYGFQVKSPSAHLIILWKAALYKFLILLLLLLLLLESKITGRDKLH